MEFHVFGSSTISGSYFVRYIKRDFPHFQVFQYSRQNLSERYCDFDNPHDFIPAGNSSVPSVWISFAPIWKFSHFFSYLVHNRPAVVSNIVYLIASSSSSALAKRFSFNAIDKLLVATLVNSESSLTSLCLSHNISVSVLRPSLIYGSYGSQKDSNVSFLLLLLRCLPFLVLPSGAGLRQPIHASQLAFVYISLIRRYLDGNIFCNGTAVEVGGDEELSYTMLLRRLQLSLPRTDPARFCIILSIPPSLFYLLASPVLLVSPKSYEAILRICSNLSGYRKSSNITFQAPQAFPVSPL